MDVFAALLIFAAILVAVFKSMLNGLLIFIAAVIALGAELIRKELRSQSEVQQAMAEDLAALRKSVKRKSRNE